MHCIYSDHRHNLKNHVFISTEAERKAITRTVRHGSNTSRQQTITMTVSMYSFKTQLKQARYVSTRIYIQS